MSLPSFKELYNKLRTGDESFAIEAKRGSEVGKSMLETICAFANEPGRGGGYILLGVAEARDSLFPDYDVVGVDANTWLVRRHDEDVEFVDVVELRRLGLGGAGHLLLVLDLGILDAGLAERGPDLFLVFDLLLEPEVEIVEFETVMFVAFENTTPRPAPESTAVALERLDEENHRHALPLSAQPSVAFEREMFPTE
jgi:hypothetical protein